MPLKDLRFPCSFSSANICLKGRAGLRLNENAPSLFNRLTRIMLARIMITGTDKKQDAMHTHPTPQLRSAMVFEAMSDIPTNIMMNTGAERNQTSNVRSTKSFSLHAHTCTYEPACLHASNCNMIAFAQSSAAITFPTRKSHVRRIRIFWIFPHIQGLAQYSHQTYENKDTGRYQKLADEFLAVFTRHHSPRSTATLI